MRRRCCCSTPVPGDCFDFWDSIGGTSDHIGSTATLTWDGLNYGNFPGSSSGKSFSLSPNIYPTFSPSLTSASVELEYIGTISSGCVWHGSFPVTISFPHITLPDDYAANGTGRWSSAAPAACLDKKYTKSWTSLNVTASFRLILSQTYWPWFQGKLILNGHYAGYNPLTGNYSAGYGRFSYDKYPVDLNNCTGEDSPFYPFVDCTGLDNLGNPSNNGRVFLNSDQELGLCAGKGFFQNGIGFQPSVFGPNDIDFPNRRLTGKIGFVGASITRHMCLPDVATGCRFTYCTGASFPFTLMATNAFPWRDGEIYIEW